MEENDDDKMDYQPYKDSEIRLALGGNESNLQISNTNDKFDTRVSFIQLEIKPEIIRALNENNIFEPSLIQSTIFPYLFGPNPRNVVAQAQTGKGKSIGYIIAALHMVDTRDKSTQVLIITPTYELSKQIYEYVLKFGKHCQGLVVDLAIKERKPANIPNRAHIVVGCCGTLLGWLSKPNWLDVSDCYLTILDEADKILIQDSHFDQLRQIQGYIQKPCLSLFCSATFSKEVIKITDAMLLNPVVILLRAEELALDNIVQLSTFARDDNHKIEIILLVYSTVVVNKTIIFCNSRQSANLLSLNLQRINVPAITISGDMPVSDRGALFTRFREGKTDRVLISTDVCSRGIDIRSVNFVINFDIPLLKEHTPDFEAYYHRIGRSGRYGDKAVSLTFHSNDLDRARINMIANYLKHKIIDIDLTTPAGAATLQQSLTKQ